jgi:hypothetical protein
MIDPAAPTGEFVFTPSGRQLPKRRSPVADRYISSGALGDFPWGAHVSDAGVVVVHPEPPLVLPPGVHP